MRFLELAPEAMRQMVNSSFSGRLLVGTDAGTALNFNVDTTREEAKLFVKWGGMAPLEAISAATRRSAQALGKGDEFGAVDPGKYADVIVVDGNPLKDITAVRRVVFVMKSGIVYKNAVRGAIPVDRYPIWSGRGLSASRVIDAWRRAAISCQHRYTMAQEDTNACSPRFSA